MPCPNCKSNYTFFFIYIYYYWRIITQCIMVQNNLGYLVENMIHLVIFHYTFDLIFQIYCFCMTFIYFSMFSRYQDLIKQNIYHFSSKLFCLKYWVVSYVDQIYIVFILHYIFVEFILLLYTFLVTSFGW